MRSRLIEGVMAGVLFAMAAVWGTVYWNRSFQAGRQPSFYQLYFEPAVMVACGHGFLRANPPVPAVADFLLLKRDRLTCADIPPNTPLTDRGLNQKPWRYLLTSVSLAWRVLGISWSGLGPLFGVLFGATIVAAYGIFRIGMNRLVSVGCAAALAVSSIHLQNLPHLRDYAKAPFTLALIFLLFTLVAGRVTWRRLLTISAAYGVVLGIGYGFRSDFLIDIPLFALTVGLFLDGGLRRHIPQKLAAGAVCAAAFALTAWPVIRAVEEGGGCQWHAVLLGLTDGPSDALMVTRAPYRFGHDFSDGYVYATATAYARRGNVNVGHVEYCSHEYDVVTGRYALEIARTFPGDAITRTIASVVQVLQLPFRWFDQPLPGWWNTLYRIRLVVLKPIRGFGVLFAALTLVTLAAVNLRYGLFGLFFLFYVGGYPMLQFDVRHYFHLEFMTWWAMGFLVYRFAIEWRAAADRRLGALLAQMRARCDWRRGVRTIVTAAAGVFIALWIGRGYQQASATRLFQEYVDAPKQAMAIGGASGLHRMSFGHDIYRDDPYPAEFLEIDVDAAHCAAPPLAFVYERPYDSFGHTVQLEDRSSAAAPTRIFEPVYAGFAGVRVNDASPECIKGMYRITMLERFPLLLGAMTAATRPPC